LKLGVKGNKKCKTAKLKKNNPILKNKLQKLSSPRDFLIKVVSKYGR